MKAILVIDMPKECLYCPCYDQDTEFGFEQCNVLLRQFESADERDNKPNWCPLKPMPRKLSVNEYLEKTNGQEHYEAVVGYNRCIDEIMGESL